MAEWIRVRTPSDTWGGNIVVGRICETRLGWVAYDDRHGERRMSLHADDASAIRAVLLRSSKTEKELDFEIADILDKLAEVRRLKLEAEGPIDAARAAEILERANEIGRSWTP